MIVYHSERTGLFFEPIEQLSSCLFENLDVEKSYVKCPAFQEYIKNTFVVRSAYDYEINLDKENSSLKSPDYGQKFFDEMILVRNLKTGLFSFNGSRPIFFSECDLEMEIVPPFFHNTLGKNVVIPGKFNIGKHFRGLECAIHCFNSGTINIKERDPLFYVKFHTNEKIKFKTFIFTETLKKLEEWPTAKRTYTKRIIPLQWYYGNTLRKKILKEIKNNIVE